MAPTGEEGGGEGFREGPGAGREERRSVLPVKGGGDGRGAVTLPTRPPPGIATIFFYRLGSFHFPPSPSAGFFPVANPLGGGASRSREAAGEGRRNHQRGTGQISAKTGESVVTRPRRRTRRLQYGYHLLWTLTFHSLPTVGVPHIAASDCRTTDICRLTQDLAQDSVVSQEGVVLDA